MFPGVCAGAFVGSLSGLVAGFAYIAFCLSLDGQLGMFLNESYVPLTIGLLGSLLGCVMGLSLGPTGLASQKLSDAAPVAPRWVVSFLEIVSGGLIGSLISIGSVFGLRSYLEIEMKAPVVLHIVANGSFVGACVMVCLRRFL
jgi:hypothetical protein